MATQPQTGLTYEDLQAFPEDNLRRELIDGELIVTAAPATRHQRVVTKLILRLGTYCEEHGGEVLLAPYDVYFSDANVVEPDVVYVASSPTTRRLELVRKRELYERFEVPEYWFIDLDADRVEVYRLDQNRYGRPLLFTRGETIDTPQGPGLALSVDDLLGAPEDAEE